MKVMKVAVVSTGAVATLAAMGSAPAFAAGHNALMGKATAIVADQAKPAVAGKHRAPVADTQQAADVQQQGVTRGGWTTYGHDSQESPGFNYNASLLSLLDGSVTNLLPWQICGSTVPLPLSLAIPLQSPNTVGGDCNNANTVLISR
jgi:hypothetical protein